MTLSPKMPYAGARHAYRMPASSPAPGADPAYPVLFVEIATASGHRIGHVRLARARQRNALNRAMCTSMLEQLRAEGVIAGAPDERQVLSRMEERLRSSTEPEAFNAAWDQGRTMSLDDGVALAIAELDRPEHAPIDAESGMDDSSTTSTA